MAPLCVLGATAAKAQTLPISPAQRATAAQVAQTGVALSELSPSAPDNYTVKSGDTLTKIARDYKVTIKQLQQANGIKGSNIKVGQKLILPVASASNQ